MIKWPEIKPRCPEKDIECLEIETGCPEIEAVPQEEEPRLRETKFENPLKADKF